MSHGEHQPTSFEASHVAPENPRLALVQTLQDKLIELANALPVLMTDDQRIKHGEVAVPVYRESHARLLLGATDQILEGLAAANEELHGMPPGINLLLAALALTKKGADLHSIMKDLGQVTDDARAQALRAIDTLAPR